MKTETTCRTSQCDQGVAERPRYYARQLITSDDLTLEQEYFRSKLRAHNRLLHGWGVVCGAEVCPNPVSKAGGGYRPWEVVVEPGYILGPYGDEIVIPRTRVIDLRSSGISDTRDSAGTDSLDPWCSEVYVPRSLEGPLYIAVKYREWQARPIRVQPAGCSCNDNQCEYSRMKDGYDISVLDHCPESDIEEIDETNIPQYLQKIGLMHRDDGLRERCYDCPAEPWVVLARVTVDGDGVVNEIDNCACRRIVVSFGPYALRCHTQMPTVTDVAPATVNAGDTMPLVMTGKNFRQGMKITFGPGITVDYASAKLEMNNTKYTVSITVDPSARSGKRAVTVINPDCATATYAAKFEVLEVAAPPQKESAAPSVKAATKTRQPATKNKPAS
jgi:hypothetical protein